MSPADAEALGEMRAWPEPAQIAAGRRLLELWDRRMGKRAVWSLAALQAREGDWARVRDELKEQHP